MTSATPVDTPSIRPSENSVLSPPFLWESGFGSDVKKDATHPSPSGTHLLVTDTTPTAKRSISDVYAAKHSRGQGSQDIQGKCVRSKLQQRALDLPQSPRPTPQRTCSSSIVELRSQYHDPAIASVTLQEELNARFKHVRERPSTSRQIQCILKARNDTEIPGRVDAASDCHARALPNTDEHLPGKLEQTKGPAPATPLKTCLKAKAKSTTTTPPSGSHQGNFSSENKVLRRVKTVDFEEATKPLLALPHAASPSEKAVHMADDRNDKLPPHSARPRKSARRMPSCPSAFSTPKSTLADPATTRTDVHVIAIAPSRNLNHEADEDIEDPATPTMQVVESNAGCYEVIWDNVPAEHKIRSHRRSSSASHSLQNLSSTATRGLQRVNTKLTDWSGSWNTPSDTFKPTIVVFPDDDGLIRPQFECAVEDDGELLTVAPPNSQRTSVAPSRLPSRPASAPMTRAASQEDIRVELAPHEDPPAPDNSTSHNWVVPLEPSHTVLDTEIFPMHTTPLAPPSNTSHLREPLSATRKLSNFEDERFRSHRDSVVLARSRLVHSSDMSQVVHAHRDSVDLAKRRMAKKRVKVGEWARNSESDKAEADADPMEKGRHIRIVE